MSETPDDPWRKRDDPGRGDQPDPTAPYQPPYGQQPTYGQQPGYYEGQVPYQQPWPQQPPYGYVAAPPNDGLGVAAMVVGIASLVLMCGYGIGLLGSPVALFMGRSSMKRIDRSGGQLGGRGMAQAGFILGIVGTVLLVLVVVAVIAGIALFAGLGDFDGGSGSSPGGI